MKTYRIEFAETTISSMQVPEGQTLVEHLDGKNPVVMFGCCQGICGTCLVEVIPLNGELAPPSEHEAETLDFFGLDNPRARLACQLKLTADISVKKINLR